MTIRVVRERSIHGATFGVVFVDDRFVCWSLEDEVRTAAKVPGATAIPAGRYPVTVTRSKRFGRDLPLLMNVPGFEGVRIHPGNGSADTEGCLLLGFERDDERQKVLRSASACVVVQGFIEAAINGGDRVFVAIENPLGA